MVLVESAATKLVLLPTGKPVVRFVVLRLV